MQTDDFPDPKGDLPRGFFEWDEYYGAPGADGREDYEDGGGVEGDPTQQPQPFRCLGGPGVGRLGCEWMGRMGGFRG
jgi:hypothetical protein